MNIGAIVLDIWLDTSSGPKLPKCSSRPQTPRPINFLRFQNITGFPHDS